MTQYIDKDVLVEEIRSRLLPVVVPHGTHYDDWDRGADSERVNILSFINTLEVKEADLESEQRMRECPYRQVVCTMYEGKILECKGACSWVVDYPKLKELKTRKGE